MYVVFEGVVVIPSIRAYPRSMGAYVPAACTTVRMPRSAGVVDMERVLTVRDARGESIDAHVAASEGGVVRVQLVTRTGPTYIKHFPNGSSRRLSAAIEKWIKKEWISARQ